MGEKEAIIRLKQGDEAAFSYLYKLYWAKAHHFARLYTASAHMAEEVVQEVFIKLWENRAGLDEEQGLDGYLFIATRNLLFNHARDSLNAPPCSRPWRRPTALRRSWTPPTSRPTSTRWWASCRPASRKCSA